MGHILLIMSEYLVRMQAGVFYFVISLFSTWQDQLLILLKPTLYLFYLLLCPLTERKFV